MAIPLIKLGATLGGLQYIGDIFPGLKEPRTFPIDYSLYVELGDGTKQGQGWLRQVWHWDVLTEDERNALFAFVGNVYVITQENDGSVGMYSALMIWPEKEPEHFADKVIDISIEMRQMVAV